MRKKNRHLTYEDRKRIEKMMAREIRVVEIAEAIGVHRATIYHELKRGGSPYSAEAAQKVIGSAPITNLERTERYGNLSVPSKGKETTSYQFSFEDLEREKK